MATPIRPGSLARLKASGDFAAPLDLQVKSLTPSANGKFKCQLSDGEQAVSGILTSQVGRAVGTTLKLDDYVRVTEADINSVNDSKVLVVAGLEILPASSGAEAAGGERPGSGKENAVGDDDAPLATPPPGKKRALGDEAAGHPTPPSSARPSGVGSRISGTAPGRGGRQVQPIASLNPYNNGWCVRARVASKGPIRTFQGRNGGGEVSVFSAELVDAAGTAIEATFWREAAARWHEALEVEGVYEFARGSVKPANKRFSSVRNDYSLNFDQHAEVARVADEGHELAKRMAAKLDPVSLSALASFADGKATVDVLGVLVSVAPLGSVKRRSDQAELSRRDLVLADDGGRSVSMTLWGEKAEAEGARLEALVDDHPVVSVSAVRVSSFNGVSLSALSRSTVRVVEPDAGEPAAERLRSWWREGGKDQPLVPAGGEGAGGAGAGGRAGRDEPDANLAAVAEAAPSDPGAKPTYATVRATLLALNPDAPLYYIADPETNKKVVEAPGGGWVVEATGVAVERPLRRYVLTARAADPSSELFVQLFNAQGEQLLGRSADELHALRESSPDAFRRALAAAAWHEWNVRVKAAAHEFQGEVRQRYAAVDLKPVDFTLDTRRMLASIHQMAQVAS